ncbi:MAG TPA: hypothetical protein PKD86_18730 [Gemmatales bacterium]|nr:hypothetical protein [Gemmatales bacterium]HMP61381.1 hypothetical protein [Gemmatales bacterium]
MGDVPFFYGIEPRWWTADRFYKVFVLPQAICAARVAGQFGDESSARAQLVLSGGLLGLLFAPLVRRFAAQRAEREAFYDTLTPGSPDFLQADDLNFVLERTDVRKVVVDANRTWWTGAAANSGRIDFVLLDGSRRRLILAGEQDTAAIARLLVDSLGSVEPVM